MEMELRSHSRAKTQTPLSQRQTNTTMHNNFFPKEPIKPSPSPSPRLISPHLRKQHSMGCAFDEDEFSNNELNMGFIADQSKLMLSDSQSVVSEGLSISNISVIRGASTPVITPLHRLQEEFSGLEEWSVEPHPPHLSLKRPNPSIEEQVWDEDLQNRCSKKKMGDRMKVVTIKSAKQSNYRSRGYPLRSRTKTIPEGESSSDSEIQHILEGLESHEADSTAAKPKIRSK